MSALVAAGDPQVSQWALGAVASTAFLALFIFAVRHGLRGGIDTWVTFLILWSTNNGSLVGLVRALGRGRHKTRRRVDGATVVVVGASIFTMFAWFQATGPAGIAGGVGWMVAAVLGAAIAFLLLR
jgi:hypothetical protein